VEYGALRDIVRDPAHPYARGLLASTVHAAKRGERLQTIPGTPPSLDQAPQNCSFAPRCQLAEPRCLNALPPAVSLAADRGVRCVRATESATSKAM
ncbi:oligopeptide/dipeptide ABC transporter ATP-binding protein, partial [Bradyrhizobium sp.]|nr:dipeptide ABC transporter ATP-binding protein DppD [Bradyrhizobium sp.]